MTYNGQRKTFFIKVGIVRQISSHAKDDYRNDNLKDTGDEHPEGCDQDMAVFALRLLHGEDEILDSNQSLFVFCWKVALEACFYKTKRRHSLLYTS